MGELPPGEHPENMESQDEMNKLLNLLIEVKIGKELKNIILADFKTASLNQKQWLFNRLELIKTSKGYLKQMYKSTFKKDWEKNINYL